MWTSLDQGILDHLSPDSTTWRLEGVFKRIESLKPDVEEIDTTVSPSTTLSVSENGRDLVSGFLKHFSKRVFDVLDMLEPRELLWPIHIANKSLNWVVTEINIWKLPVFLEQSREFDKVYFLERVDELLSAIDKHIEYFKILSKEKPNNKDIPKIISMLNFVHFNLLRVKDLKFWDRAFNEKISKIKAEIESINKAFSSVDFNQI